MKDVIFFLLFPFMSFGQRNYSASFDSFMNAEVAINHFNGNILVAKSGNIVYNKSFGYRNYETKELLDTNSVFELESISKQFTAVAILQLIEKGKLKLSDSLRKFFPQLPYHNITIQNLLTHTSGLPLYDDELREKWDHKKIAFNDDLINFLAVEKIPVHFEAGTKWEYCGTGYELLASVIERISGVSFNDYMRRDIFEPLGMKHTRIYNTRRSLKDTIPNYAFGYVYSDSLKKYVIPDSLEEYNYVFYLDGLVGDGQVNSTTGDLLIWDRALKNHLLLSEQMQNEMFSPHAIVDTAAGHYYGYGSTVYYGYGVDLGKDDELGRKYLAHGGDYPGYVTFLIRYPDDDVTIIVLSNNHFTARGIATALANIFYNKQVVLPYLHREIDIDTFVLDKYVGKYKFTATKGIFEIVKRDGKIFGRTSTGEIAYKPESGTKFFAYDNFFNREFQIEFEINSQGNISRAYFITTGVKREMEKIE
jgi:CubicO group peptidase (beta-lactamase class C family)